MDKLVKPDVEELNLHFTRAHKSSATFNLTNLMHTMSVAVSLTTTNPSLFSSSPQFCIVKPLSTACFKVSLARPSDLPPVSSPLDSVLVRSSMLPTGKATQDDLHRVFSRPGPHIFKDAKIPICFVGADVVEFLLSASSSNSLESNFLLPKAISWCRKPQLNSLLRSAARMGNSHAVSALIEAGADVNSRDFDGVSAMGLAVEAGSIDSVEVLIRSGYTIDNRIDRFLHQAAAIDRVDLMEILCLGYIDIDFNSRDSKTQTALHVAAIQSHIESLQFLVSIGCDPDLQDANKWTPLHHAAKSGQIRAVEILVNSSKLAKSLLTKDGKTPFDVAVERGHSDLYDMLRLGDALHRAARTGDVGGLSKCLAEGANVNGRDQNGWTPLHRAAFKGRLECVKALLKHGAKVDPVDDCGYMPLHRAIEMGHRPVALYLIAHGAKPNFKGLKPAGAHPSLTVNSF
nr:ankyrin repeat, PH and SEC7 domain containing protein secG-like [Ipomoea batatas]GME16310.1 ankyrin repeat, PH and SEC7 domain containing protein secG-like [Ipomoea batatas]